MPAEEGKAVKRTNRAAPPRDPEPTKGDFNGTEMWYCPGCGRSDQDRDRLAQHMAFAHPGEHLEGGEQK